MFWPHDFEGLSADVIECMPVVHVDSTIKKVRRSRIQNFAYVIEFGKAPIDKMGMNQTVL